jgi:hypothetical protein
MLVAATITVTALLWGCLIASGIRYWRDSQRSEAKETLIENLRYEAGVKQDQFHQLESRHTAECSDLNRRLGKQCGDNNQLLMENGILQTRASDAYSRGRQDLLDQQAKATQKPVPTPAQNALMMTCRDDFNGLTWLQRVVLRQICTSPKMSEMELLLKLQNLGIPKSPEYIIQPLIQNPLIEFTPVTSNVPSSDDGHPLDSFSFSSIEVKSGKLDCVWALLEETPLC